jgi:hypothetical protein
VGGRETKERERETERVKFNKKNVLQTANLQVTDHHIPLKTAFDVSDSADLP